MMKYGIHTWAWPLCGALLLFAAQPLRAAQASLGASAAAEVRSATELRFAAGLPAAAASEGAAASEFAAATEAEAATAAEGAGFAGFAEAAGTAVEAAAATAAEAVRATDAGTRVAAAPSSERSQRAEELLRRLAASIRALGDYGVSFAVESGDQTVEGHYSVSGNRYSMTLGDAEVFCDGKVRYEVDHRRREVVIDRVNESSRNIVDNPTRAFDFLDAQYRASLVSEVGSCAVVRLTPAEEGALPVGSILLEVDTSAAKPRSLTYDFDGEQIVVRVSRIAAEHAALRTFDASACKGYEFIDFR